MAYTHDWAGTSGTWSADWVTSNNGTGGTVDLQSNSGRMLTSATAFNTQRAILGATQWTETDGEALVDTTLQSANLGVTAIALRSSGTWSSTDTNFPTSGYVAYLDHENSTISFYKVVASTLNLVGSPQTFAFATGVTYRNRFRVQGTDLKIKVWPTADGEPVAWTYEQTDSSVTGTGRFMVSFRNTDADARDVRWDNVLLEDALPSGGGGSASLFAENWAIANGLPWPAQWSTELAGAGTVIDVQNQKGRMATGTAIYGKVAARNSSALANIDYTLTVDVALPTFSEWYFYVHVRGNSSTSGTLKLLSSYQIRFVRNVGSVNCELYEVAPNGVETYRANGTVSGSPIAGDTIRVMVEVSGNPTITLKQKAWRIGSTEPAYTDLSANVVTAFTGAYFNVAVQGGNNTASDTFTWDNLTINTPFFGSASPTEIDDVLVASGSFTITGVGALADVNDTLVASGNSGMAGTAAATETDDALAATGTVDVTAVTGTASLTEEEDTAAGAGTFTITGTAAVTEDEDVSAAAGNIVLIDLSGRRPVLMRS